MERCKRKAKFELLEDATRIRRIEEAKSYPCDEEIFVCEEHARHLHKDPELAVWWESVFGAKTKERG
jgi:hypothetical protein